MPQTIILVRHGETDLNKSHRLMNWSHDVGTLTDQGQKEAAIVGNKLKEYRIDAMYASDLRRTRETAAIIATHVSLTPVLTPSLRERNLGIFGDHTFDELNAKWPDKVAKFLDHSDQEWNGLEGESLRDVQTRFDVFLTDLHARHHDQSILLVTHSGFLYIVLRDYFNFLPRETWLDVDHTSVTVLEKSAKTYTLTKFNEV